MKPIILPPTDKKRETELILAVPLVLAFQPKHPIRLKFEVARPDRTPPQNRYWWAVPMELLHQATGYEKEELHEWFCGSRWGWIDRRCPKTPANPRGIESKPIRTTTTNENGEPDICSMEDFTAMWAHAQRLGAKHDTIIPDPDPDWWKK